MTSVMQSPLLLVAAVLVSHRAAGDLTQQVKHIAQSLSGISGRVKDRESARPGVRGTGRRRRSVLPQFALKGLAVGPQLCADAQAAAGPLLFGDRPGTRADARSCPSSSSPPVVTEFTPSHSVAAVEWVRCGGDGQGFVARSMRS